MPRAARAARASRVAGASDEARSSVATDGETPARLQHQSGGVSCVYDGCVIATPPRPQARLSRVLPPAAPPVGPPVAAVGGGPFRELPHGVVRGCNHCPVGGQQGSRSPRMHDAASKVQQRACVGSVNPAALGGTRPGFAGRSPAIGPPHARCRIQSFAACMWRDDWPPCTTTIRKRHLPGAWGLVPHRRATVLRRRD